jgi:uncharacterized membrane protein YjfL (UPF0719 family)
MSLLDRIGRTSIANILGVIIVLGCFVMMYFMMIKEIPKENISTVNQAVGFVFGCLGFVMGYFYGSSKNNESKP